MLRQSLFLLHHIAIFQLCLKYESGSYLTQNFVSLNYRYLFSLRTSIMRGWNKYVFLRVGTLRTLSKMKEFSSFFFTYSDQNFR